MTPDGIRQLKLDEGLLLHAYPDPLTNADPWTIGYGHTGPEVKKGLAWTQAQADAALAKDIAKHEAELDAALPWAKALGPVRHDVLVNMSFNMGVPNLLKFKNTLAMMKAGNFAGAADGMLASLWAKQVKGRAIRLADKMRKGA